MRGWVRLPPIGSRASNESTSWPRTCSVNRQGIALADHCEPRVSWWRQVPLQMLDTDIGTQRVQQELREIEYGMPL